MSISSGSGSLFVLMRPYRDQKLKIRNSNSKGMTKILKDPVQIAYRLIADKLFFWIFKITRLEGIF